MWFYRTMLVVTITTLVFCGTDATSNKISTPANIPGRLRRLTPSIDSAFPNVKDSDERGILSNLKTNLGDWSKTTYWAVLGKSDDYVKKKLGLQTLTGTALTNHPNYQLLAKFRYNVEGRMLGTWFEEGLTMNGAWARLKLNQVDQTRVMQTDAYETYMRYVQMYDDWIYHFKNSMLDDIRIDFSNNQPQVMAQVTVWVAAGRSRGHVKDMLHLADPALRKTYYSEFLRLSGKQA